MSSRGSATARLVIVATCALVTWVFLGRASRAEEVPPTQPLETLPRELAGWVGWDLERFSPEVEAMLGVDEYVSRAYVNAEGLPIQLYLGYHASQRQGDAMHSPLNCLPGAGWQPLEVGRVPLRAQGLPGHVDGEEAEVLLNRVVIGKGLDRQLVYYWYQSHRRVVASEYWGKIYTVVDAVRDNRTDAAMVRLVVPIPEAAMLPAIETELRAFARALLPVLTPYFPQ